MTTLSTHAFPNLRWQDALHLLTHFAQSTTTDMALLHSSTFSLLALNPLSTFQTSAAQISDPLDQLQAHLDSFSFDVPHPLVGWLGFISYDLARILENIPTHNPASAADLPLLHWQLFDTYLLFNHAEGSLTLHTVGDVDPAPMISQLENMLPADLPPSPSAKLILQQPREDFLRSVERIKDYIADGHIYQANLAQRWIAETHDEPHHLFRRLCRESPAPYAVYLRFTYNSAQHHILSASPELFLTLEEGHLVTRPIKGTRPRFADDPAKDAAARAELLASEKDKAELAMIVDLLRNDLGRVSEFGSVQVTAPRAVEQHPTVWHTVATIESTLKQSASLRHILRALCPGGSITGAPKIRATQIIEELEPFRRNLYCGNIGVIGPRGGRGRSLALNIAIRTIQITGNRATFHAGAGIVADSDPEKEYDETLHKAAALFRALGIAELNH